MATLASKLLELVWIYLQVDKWICGQKCTHICTHTHTHTQTHWHIHTKTHTHTHTEAHSYFLSHTNTYTHTEADRWTHTDTQIQMKGSLEIPKPSSDLFHTGWRRGVSWCMHDSDNLQDVIFDMGYRARLFRNSTMSSTNPSPSVISFRKSSGSSVAVWQSMLLSISMGFCLQPSTWKSSKT